VETFRSVAAPAKAGNAEGVIFQQAEQTKIVMHLGQAIDAQTKNQETLASDEFENALEAGFDHPALYFNLGLLRSKTERTESALRHLGHAVKHVDYVLGTRLLMGELLVKMGRTTEASIEYLEALKSDKPRVSAPMSCENFAISIISSLVSPTFPIIK